MTTDETATGHTPSPPTAAQLLNAWDKIGRPGPVEQVMLHLGTPNDVAVSAGAWATADRFTLRGRVAPARGNQPDQVAVDVSTAARTAVRRTDRYLDLHADPSTWIKVLRSGVHRIAYGADLLFGFPPLLLADNVDPAAASELLRAWRRGELRDFPALFTAADQLYVAEGNHERVVMNSVSKPASNPLANPADQGLRNIGETSAALAHDLDALSCSVADITAINSAELRCRVIIRMRRGPLIAVPLHYTGGELHAGQRASLDLRTDLELPPGFDQSAVDDLGRTWIRHQATGLIVEHLE